ncbi:hypothetical protein C2G38_2296770 [Gigaspora rosea]|uniref:Uncharacterized protein n=1 Tax=Gigaspora rosea TaxID=44941 RepID=A0A397U1J5_9GLOM|nr:hypothetical protein C2G38_2296770 [Gigaspora rosea]
MPSHVALIVAIVSARNNQSFFISSKFVIENSEQCVTVTYVSIIDNNPSREFDTTNIPPCIPHCMFSVVVNRKPKELREFIHFGVECTEYNSVTSNSSVNMQITVLYHAGSSRFQNYLGHSGSNIKLGSTYLVSGLFKISTSGKMMIEATDVDYMKTAAVTYNAQENYSSTTPGAQSIIDIIADDIESKPNQVPKVVDPTIPSVNRNAAATPGSSVYIDLDAQDEEEEQSDHDDDEKDTELDEEEESQPEKRKKSVRLTKKDEEEESQPKK